MPNDQRYLIALSADDSDDAKKHQLRKPFFLNSKMVKLFLFQK